MQAERAEQTATDALCERGHPLGYQTASEDHQCDRCNRDIVPGIGFFNCRLCDFGVCATCEKAAALSLPRHIARLILGGAGGISYTDILRVGKTTLNDMEMVWDTIGSTEVQFQRFSAELLASLQCSAHCSHVGRGLLHRLVYWVCKAVSFNYVLYKVFAWLQEHVDSNVASIATRGCQYFVDILPGPCLHASLRWPSGDNIWMISPCTGEKKVKGSFLWLSTEFTVPPDPLFVPNYEFQIKLKKCLASRVLSSMACGGHDAKETLTGHGPLYADAQLDHKVSKTVSEPQFDAPADTAEEDERHRALSDDTGLHVPSHRPTGLQLKRHDDGPVVGSLIVHLLRARGLRNTDMFLGVAFPGICSDPYVTCTLAGMCRRTRSVSNCLSPEWNEEFRFPLRKNDLRSDVAFSVLDDNAGEKDEPLGLLNVPVNVPLLSDRIVFLSEPLMGEVSDGILEFEMRYEPARSQPRSIVMREEGAHLRIADAASDEEEEEEEEEEIVCIA